MLLSTSVEPATLHCCSMFFSENETFTRWGKHSKDNVNDSIFRRMTDTMKAPSRRFHGVHNKASGSAGGKSGGGSSRDISADNTSPPTDMISQTEGEIIDNKSNEACYSDEDMHRTTEYAIPFNPIIHVPIVDDAKPLNHQRVGLMQFTTSEDSEERALIGRRQPKLFNPNAAYAMFAPNKTDKKSKKPLDDFSVFGMDSPNASSDADDEGAAEESRLVDSKQPNGQGRLLLVSLLENFCDLYDQDPEKNKRLFLALCKRLYSMGVLFIHLILLF